jgi:predicted nuclease of predicted toxin-antitoxin system
VKLLFDHNLSPKLPRRLSVLFPVSTHVADVGLERATDIDVWTYAATNAFVIVTKDSDFNDIGTLRGFPPKIIWLRLGNCTTSDVERTLRAAQPTITEFIADPSAGVLELY